MCFFELENAMVGGGDAEDGGCRVGKEREGRAMHEEE